MSLYMLGRDNRVTQPLKLADIPDYFNSQMDTQLESGDLRAAAFRMDTKNVYEYADFIFIDRSDTAKHRGYGKYFVISDKLQVIFSKYNPQTLFKPFAINNAPQARQDVYWLCKIEPAIQVENFDDTLYQQLQPYQNHRIIRADSGNDTRFFVTLEVVESILRRGAHGAMITELKG